MKLISFYKIITLLSCFALTIYGCASTPPKLFGLSNEANLSSSAQINRTFQGHLWVLEGSHEYSSIRTSSTRLPLKASRKAGLSSKWYKTFQVVHTPDATNVDAQSALLPSGIYTFISRGTKVVKSTIEGDTEVVTFMTLPIISVVKELKVGCIYHVQRFENQDGSQGISVKEAQN